MSNLCCNSEIFYVIRDVLVGLTPLIIHPPPDKSLDLSCFSQRNGIMCNESLPLHPINTMKVVLARSVIVNSFIAWLIHQMNTEWRTSFVTVGGFRMILLRLNLSKSCVLWSDFLPQSYKASTEIFLLILTYISRCVVALRSSVAAAVSERSAGPRSCVFSLAILWLREDIMSPQHCLTQINSMTHLISCEQSWRLDLLKPQRVHTPEEGEREGLAKT